MAYPDYEAARLQAIKEISSLGHEAYWDSLQLKTKAGTPINIIIDRHGNKQYTFVNSQGKKYAFSSNGKFVPVVSKSLEEWNKVDKERTDTSRLKKEDNKSWWLKLGPYVAPGQITGIVETALQASNIPYKLVNGKYALPTALQTKDAKNALTIGSIAAPIATVAGAVLPAVAPGTIGGNIIGDIAGWEAVNKTSDLLTGKTFGGHIRSGIGLIPGANEFLYSSSYLSTPYEMFTDIVGNPMSYNTVRTAVGKGVDKVYTGILNSVLNFQNRYFFVPRSYSYTRGIGRGTEGLNDLMTTGIVRGNPRGTEVTANSFAKLYRKNRDHFRDIMLSTGISNIESKFFSRNLTEEEFNAIKEASKNYTKPRLSKNLETIYVLADPLERYSTYAAYINDINKTVKEVELMPSRILSGEIKVNPTLTNLVDSNIPTGLPIEERFGANSDYIGDGTPLAYFYSDGRNPLTQGYDYAGSDYGVRINNPLDYTPFLHELHLHPSFFNAPKLSDPNVELFGRGPFGLTLKLDKTTGKPLLFQEPVNFFRNIFSLTSNVRRPTIYSLGLSSQQRGSISDELFLRGKLLEDALKGNVIANITLGHGMSKGQTIEDLEQLLTNGIDKNRSWFSAPLDVEMGGSGFGTASGKPYTNGPFIVIGYPNDPSWSKGIQGILYNDALVNGYNYLDIINYMKNKYPLFKHMTYDEYAKEIGGTIPQQYLANNYNNSFNIVSKSDNQLSALPDEIVLDMNPTTREAFLSNPGRFDDLFKLRSLFNKILDRYSKYKTSLYRSPNVRYSINTRTTPISTNSTFKDGDFLPKEIANASYERMVDYVKSPEYAKRLNESNTGLSQQDVLLLLETTLRKNGIVPIRTVEGLAEKQGLLGATHNSFIDVDNNLLSPEEKKVLLWVLDHEYKHYMTHIMEPTPKILSESLKMYRALNPLSRQEEIAQKIIDYNESVTKRRTIDEILKTNGINLTPEELEDFKRLYKYYSDQLELTARGNSIILKARENNQTVDEYLSQFYDLNGSFIYPKGVEEDIASDVHGMNLVLGKENLLNYLHNMLSISPWILGSGAVSKFLLNNGTSGNKTN